jgi:glucose-1-phosphate thymidylyltransferase
VGGADVKALVLAAGYATRLYPLTLDRPKALLDVGGRPMLDHIYERLLPLGIDGTIVVTNAKFAPHFEAWAEGRGNVTVVNDGTTSNDDRLGAIGDIGYVLDRLGLDEELVVVAGDNLFSDDIAGLTRSGREVEAAVVAVHDVGDLSLMGEYNQIEVDEDGRIVFFEEKPAEPRTTLSGVALYYYPRQSLPLIRQYLADGQNPDQPGRLVQWLYPRTPVYAWRLPGEWYDIGSTETLEEADRIFSQSRNS